MTNEQRTALNIPKIFVINLKHRTDRLTSISNELEKLGLLDLMEVVEATQFLSHGTGTAAIAISHKSCIELAKTRGYENIMILQDDCKFLVDREEFISEINTFLKRAENENWNGLWFGSFYQAQFSSSDQKHAVPIRFNQDTGTVINKRGYDEFIKYLNYCSEQYLKTGLDIYNIDQLMFNINMGCNREQEFCSLASRTRVLRKKLCGQADNFSDRLLMKMCGGICQVL